MPLAQEDVTIDPAVIAGVLSRIYHGRYGKAGDKGIDRRLFEATHEVFNLATASGIAEAVNRGVPAPSAQFLELLDRNNAIFSAFRTHKMQKDVASLLLDDEGKIKKFANFKRDVTPVIGKYNGAWLRTEYATAVQRSRLATKWQQFVDESDVFPNLEWMQSTALHPGKDHRIFWYTVRPVNDPFWSQHRPGDRWNCQCDLRQTDLPPTDIPTIPIGDAANSPAPGLDNNPGTDGVIFNDNHPYFPKNCTTCPFANMGKKLMCLFGSDKKSCLNCRLPFAQFDKEYQKNRKYYERIKDNDEFSSVEFDETSGGVLAIHKNHNYDTTIGKFGIPRGEYELYAAKFLQSRGYRVVMQNEQQGDGVKVADLLIDGIRGDIKAVEEKGNYTIANAFKKAERQRSSTVILYFHDPDIFADDYIDEQWDKFLNLRTHHGYRGDSLINTIVCITQDQVLYYKKSD